MSKLVTISSERTRNWPDIAELVGHRSLIFMLAKRQIRGRYAQTVLGIFWTLIQPISYMVVLNVFFSFMARFPSGQIPYPLFLLSGLLLFQFFTRCLTDGAASLSSNEALLGKVFIPRMIFPVISVAVASVDLGITMVFFFLLFLIYGFFFSLKIFLVIGVFCILYILAFGVAILFAALAAKYRDLRLALPTIAQMFLFASPIMYDITVIPERFHIIWALNPLVGLITAFRWCVFPDYPAPDATLILTSLGVGLFLLVTALFYFQRTERNLVDAL